jgi:hypothetical protein
VLEDVVEADAVGNDVAEVIVVVDVAAGRPAYRPSAGRARETVQVEILAVLMRLKACDSGQGR